MSAGSPHFGDMEKESNLQIASASYNGVSHSYIRGTEHANEAVKTAQLSTSYTDEA